jgi:hypothetical protein
MTLQFKKWKLFTSQVKDRLVDKHVPPIERFNSSVLFIVPPQFISQQQNDFNKDNCHRMLIPYQIIRSIQNRLQLGLWLRGGVFSW